MSFNRLSFVPLALLIAGCVTINIYFPEAEAQQAADRIIDEVRGTGADDAGPELPESGAVGLDGVLHLALGGLGRALDVLVPPAAAQADFDATSPAARALEQSLKQRFPEIKPHLDSGAVGLTAAGLLDVRDRNAVPLKDRNRVRQLVAEQNADWEALYKEIARINGHPEWIDRIREVFAERWVAKAARGWYYRDAAGGWKQK